MNEETKKKIAGLESQLTPRGAYEAVMWGVSTAEGRRFCEIYAQIRELEGNPVELAKAA